MATPGGIAPHTAGVRGDEARRVDVRALSTGETAWLLLAPALLVAVLAIALLGPPLGRLAFDGTHYEYWPSAAGPKLFPKPTELARFALTVLCALAFAPAIAIAARRRLRLRAAVTRHATAGIQLLLVGGLVLCWAKQRDLDVYPDTDATHFSTPTIVVACGLAALGALALAHGRVLERVRLPRPTARLRVASALAAAVLTAVWLLPSVFTDANIGLSHPAVIGHMQFSFDEAMSVLNRRSPLVDMATYGALVPYLAAPPLAALGASLTAYTVLMTTLTALALLAVYAILRRLTRSSVLALALYVPVLATSLFLVQGDTVERFTFANYFGMFPIRYGGPYALAWLLVRHLDGARPRSVVPLFAVAGLVVLNNTDFGLPAFAATFAALVCAGAARDRRALLRLVGGAAGGAAIAFGLVTMLTLLRAGTLPHLDRLFAYARLFGVAGYGNLPTPLFGFHVVVLATFVAALAWAAVRGVQHAPESTLTGMLAWCGVFGLGTGSYFAYRSHPNSLVASFSIWALTLAVLLVATARTRLTRGPALPSPATLALLVGCGLAVGSIAQLPLPWRQVDRIAHRSPERPLEWRSAERFIRTFVAPGARVAILIPLGHRVGYDLGIENVVAYTGMLQMPTHDQLRETIAVLRSEGGDTLFLGEQWWPEVEPALEAAGFRRLADDPVSGFVAWRDTR